MIDNLKKAVYHSESALKETYNTASLELSSFVKGQNIKVVLTGEGADELFGGYIGYRFDQLKLQQGKQFEALPQDEIEARRKLWGDETFLYERNYIDNRRIKKEMLSEQVNEIYDSIECCNSPILNLERLQNTDVFHKRSYIDFKLRMSDHLLSDHGDRMAYANSVEARYPFLDKDLIEFAITIPNQFKMRNFNEKYILKKVAERMIPPEITRRPKFAFTAPGSSELLKQDIEYINDILSFEVVKRQGYFNPHTVEKLKKKYMQEGFRLNVPYEDDMLIIVLTFGMLLEFFDIPDLN
jgi:asparagine synthase (glutamine-hydrolysing)